MSISRKNRVLISVPNQGWVHRNVIFAVIELLQDQRVQTTLIMPTHSPYEHNMNRIALDCVKGEYDFWLNIDADNPPMRNPLDLVFLDLDVVACPTPQWHDGGVKDERPYYFVACDKAGVDGGYKEHLVKDNLQEVDAIGSGCMLVARRVLTVVRKPFERIYDDDGLVIKGADFNFCDKAKFYGFRIFAHYGYPCRHYKEIDMVSMIESMGGRTHG